MKQIVNEYFNAHPEEKDGVLKAWYAYHAPHFRVMLDLPLHNFTSSQRFSKCMWCGRSREMVRHDEESGQCSKRPEIREIKEVLHDECVKANALYELAKTEVPKLIRKMGMTGETVAILHHTYGYDPETVAGIVDVPPQVMADYHTEMEVERNRSRNAQVKQVITVQLN